MWQIRLLLRAGKSNTATENELRRAHVTNYVSNNFEQDEKKAKTPPAKVHVQLGVYAEKAKASSGLSTILRSARRPPSPPE